MSAQAVATQEVTLSGVMQSIARNYLAARGRAGEAILDAARYLAEARQAAKYGEWGVFLEATGTQEDTATRMIAIASRAAADQQYALAVRDGRLAFTAAFELLSAPKETQQRALESDAPTQVKTIREEKRESKVRTSAEFVPAPDHYQPLAAPIELPIPTGDDAADDAALVASIRDLATPLGLQMIWEDGKVLLHWPHEIDDIDQMDLLSYGAALEWLTWEAKGIKQDMDAAKDAPAPAQTATPFWQSMSPNHPTAHLWTRTGMNEHHAACGMVSQREPSGNTEAGHCSNCVRATWPQNQIAEQPKIPEGAPTIEALDATLPRTLSDAGYYWKAAEPLTIAHNDGWYTTAATVEAALNLAHDHAQERVEANDRRLTPGAHAQAVSLLVSIRTDLITDQIGSAERHTRQLLAVIEKGEAED